MIISRTPLRMSFVGGGSDMPSYYEHFGGSVISCTINKYIYITVNKKFDDAIRLSYSRTENVQYCNDVEHPLVRAALNVTGIKGGIEITSIADIPSSGSGLGSSSSFTVGLLHALYAYKGLYVDAANLASESCNIEIKICGSPIGKQDQYAAAYGGLNRFDFHRNSTVSISPIICAPEFLQKFQNNILLFYTGKTRSSNSILSSQSKKLESSVKTQNVMKCMVDLTTIFEKSLSQGDCDTAGEILHETWQLKRKLTSSISDAEIDSWYETGRKHGALGGKLLGAGAGGFLMFYAPQSLHDRIAHALPSLRHIPFAFEPEGSSIIFYRP